MHGWGLRESQSLLRQAETNVHYAPEYRFRFPQRMKICSSGLQMFLSQRLFKGQRNLNYFMLKKFYDRRAFFHLKNDSTCFCFLRMHHKCGFESDITAFYFANIHHTFCLFNPPQFSNPILVIGKIAWTLYFGRVFDNKVIDINESMANRLATYGHKIIGDPLSSLVLAMTNRAMCNFLLSKFQDKQSIYYHIAWAEAYLNGFCVPANTDVFEKLRLVYWQVKIERIETTIVLKLREHNMLWNGSVCLDAILALSEMTNKGLRRIQQSDPTMAERLITNLRGKTFHYPSNPRYLEKEKLLCGN